MKNKIVLFLFFIFLTLSFVGCEKQNKNVPLPTNGANEERVELETGKMDSELESIEVETGQSEEQENYKSELIFNPDGIEYEELPDDIKGLLVSIDSLLLYHVENDAEYVSNDPEMFWMVMHYAIGNFGTFYNWAELREYELAVGSKVIHDFASAIVANSENIPAIPDSLSMNIRYDNEEDLYFFGVGDRGLSQTQILSYEYIDMDTLKVSARLFAMDDNSTITKGDFVFKRNHNANCEIEPLFYFTVSEVEFVEE